MSRGGPRRPEVSLLNLAGPGHSQAEEQPRQVPTHRGHPAGILNEGSGGGQALALECRVLWGPIELSP